ncbi:hypothetical protein JJB11_21895 [Ramlibacter ginsenosidimutans]|uniref:Uncharacterized protein n=1 Tax=Ramlibacter ginsenosidimutans TaxID=502333 RepID=A0A934TWQ7_9BURK|nr:hypothetical protein [Ramlibacter ginsenosidimutans]MBK6008760.1 hypothetical protein [Ramlibacter ginsenosidimutans]
MARAKVNPTAGQFANGAFKAVLAEALIKALQSHHSMSDQMLQNPKVFEDEEEALLPQVAARLSLNMFGLKRPRGTLPPPARWF